LNAQERTYLYGHGRNVIDAIIDSKEEKLTVDELDINYHHQSELGCALSALGKIYQEEIKFGKDEETSSVIWNVEIIREKENLEDVREYLTTFER
jgi:hypothetical protein